MANYTGLFFVIRRYFLPFRRAKEIDDILTIAMEDDEEIVNVEFDPLVKWPGYDNPMYEDIAQQHYESYSANIQVQISLFIIFRNEIYIIIFSRVFWIHMESKRKASSFRVTLHHYEIDSVIRTAMT